jgi:hypothetical protein
LILFKAAASISESTSTAMMDSPAACRLRNWPDDGRSAPDYIPMARQHTNLSCSILSEIESPDMIDTMDMMFIATRVKLAKIL